MLRHWNVIVFISTILFFSCNTAKEELPNTPTTGEIHIIAENTFQYILPPQIDLFTSIYKNTKVSYSFKGEQECIQSLLNDSCKVILINRSLSSDEIKVFEKNNIIIQQTPIAYTAIALIGKKFREKGLLIDDLKRYLEGNDSIKFVFYKKNNGAILYMKDSLLNGKSFGKNCFIVEDSAEFKNYCLEKDFIGIIDYSFICDNDDKWTYQLKFPKNDTLLIPIRRTATNPAFYPDQSNIATKDYPFVRTIYCIRRGDNFSLSAGIEAFLAGEKGQILFKKMGLVPVFERERKIEMRPY